VANSADSISLVSTDSTKQHGVHVFDVSCHICTGSHEHKNTHASDSTNTLAASCQCAVLPNEGDSLLRDVSKSDQSPRKKICLAQRLKMYSTELERNSVSIANKQIDVSEVSSSASEIVAKVVTLDSAVKESSGADEMSEPSLDKPKLIMATTAQHIQTVQNLQNDCSVEQQNSNLQKLQECSVVVHEELQKDKATDSRSGTAKQQSDLSTWEFGALQEAHFKKSHVAGYVVVHFVIPY